MSAGNGDLWPSCWAADGNLYAANGDGTNFGSAFDSMAVGKIAGMPPKLTGTFVAGDVGQNYSEVLIQISRPACCVSAAPFTWLIRT